MKKLLFFLLLCSGTILGQNNLTLSNANNQHSTIHAPLKIGDEEALNLQTQHPYNTNGTTGIIFEKEFYSKNSSYIKLYFKNFNLAPGDYVEITSPNTGESIIYGGQGKIIDANMTMISDFWTKVLFDERVIVRLHAQNVSNYYGFDIARVAYGYPQAKIDEILASKSICGGDEKEPIICYNGTTMYNKGKAVCRLLINGSSLCTGWLLGCDGNLMTNNHCVGNASSAANTDFMFNYHYTNCNGTGNSTSDVVASSSTFIKTSSSLDYTLLKLPVNPTSTYGYLSLSSVAPAVNDRIYIVGHPGGRRKEITVKTDQGGDANGNAQVNQVTTNGIRYYADTEGGSSGSPVLDYNSNLVVAIHNTGGCTNGSYGRSDKLIADIGSAMPNCGVDNGGSTTPPTSCGTTVSSFPYTESFENTLGAWMQGSGDNFDWATRSGSTPSSNTGPSAASSGTYYIYMESSSPNYSTKTAILNSPCFDLSGLSSPSLTFKYHMYGATSMGNLKLEASTDGTTWTSIWSKAGNQGNSWQTATVSLAAYTSANNLKLRFNGTTGTTWQGDMAVDAFSISGGSTTPSCIATSLSLTFDNYPEETSWTIKNNAGTTVASGGTYASQADGSTLVINQCLDAGCYTLTINDSYGDGICCAYGNGSYTLTNNATGATLASGGSFTSSETKSFCVGSARTESTSIAEVNNTAASTFLSVGPNPFNDYLEIQTNIEGLSQYTLTNLQGQVVKTGSINNKTVLLNDLNPGVYFITFANDKKQLVRKVIKQ
ncbi:trypsin-like peptidase domain-containing protein [Aureispira anguillae]|uniref:Trypsin-like peptidase domain-containing protein n=1 Tax=Aureispira anguillae TaxID=2864201 RepID=A0A916DS60_9BACT|nr:trypsin-like peptidase domain-containing protein [Aureispira anguillae]BDS11020.1 trypsin-like peptidase domain-containing protein [Aureispira anguillae]